MEGRRVVNEERRICKERELATAKKKGIAAAASARTASARNGGTGVDGAAGDLGP